MKPYWVKRKYNTNTISWQEALDNLQYSRSNDLLIKVNPPSFFVCHEGHKIKKVKHVMKDLKCHSAHLYINAFSQEENSGNHKDQMDVWFWQCQGRTKWIIDKKEITLREGDLLFIKKQVYHKVIALGPRVGVSMSDIKYYQNT